MNRFGDQEAATASAGAACAAGAAGLVSSKTSLHKTISLSKEVCNERRVRRLRRSVWAAGHLHGMAQNGHRAPVPWFVTLTYAPGAEWRPKDVAGALQAYRNWCRSKGVPCRYIWVAELQQRGAVHYHLLVWLPQGVRMPKWDKPTQKARGGLRPPFWPYGMTNTEQARAGVGYLMKYLSKYGELTTFPPSIRLYGVGGLCDDGRKTRAWYNLPEWVKRSFGVGEVVRQAGRLLVSATGEILQSPFKVSRVPGGFALYQLRELPPRFHDGAYCSVTF